MSAQDSIIRIAAALIEDEEGRLLLVRKRSTDAFMQAGGKMEPGEAPEAALARELQEELGQLPDRLEPLGIFTAPAANEPGHQVEAHVYRACMSGELQAAAEIEELCWVTTEEAELLPLAPLTRDHLLPLVATV